jgi:hypothetical protein
MERQSGRRRQQHIWDDTRNVLEAGVPDVIDVYTMVASK